MEGVRTITMDPGNALAVYQRYRAACRDAHRAEWRAQDKVLKAAYRQLARGYAIVDLVAAFRDTGLGADHRPKLAIARADVRTCFVDVISGGADFFSLVDGRARHQCPRITIPRETWPATGWTTGTALVPFMPPDVRPKSKLEKFWILWEARWDQVPPVDPMLLQPLGRNLWVVRATWDLTDVERAVMEGALRG